MAVDEVVDVIAMWHGRMAATGSVHVSGFVACAAVGWRAAGGIGGGDIEGVLVDVVAVGMVEMTVVEVVDVSVVGDADVSAVGTVDMGVIGMDVAGVLCAHGRSLNGMRDRRRGSGFRRRGRP